MDISRLQPRSQGPVSRKVSLPLGLQIPIEVDAIPQVIHILSGVDDSQGDIDLQVFGHFASAWTERLDRFLTDDPIWRA